MAIGPGKYDAACTAARTSTRARGLLLIVIGGEHGDGFSCQADASTTLALPEILEHVAAELRATFTRAATTFRPDHNGECLNCDEPLDAHDAAGRCPQDDDA